MIFEDALKLVDAAVFSRTGRRLSAPEVTILKGTWEGMTYDQMAETSQYSLNYLMRDIGPRLWNLLSEALGEKISKPNFRVALERRSSDLFLDYEKTATEYSRGDGKEQEEVSANQTEGFSQGFSERKLYPSVYETRPQSDWGEAPDVPSFYDRAEEIATLKQWFLDDNCRLVALRGISGMGKTAIARKLVEEIKDQFECVIWRSLAQAPTPIELLRSLLPFLPFSSPRSESDPVTRLMASLRSHRCLLILDGTETILRAGQLAGRYREGYQDYGELLRRIGRESHQSGLLITGLENPREITLLEGKTAPVRSLSVSSLPDEAAQEILHSASLVSEENWSALLNRYQGNPAIIKIVAKLIRELFNGNVSEFLERDTFVFGDISERLTPLFSRLSEEEKEVLHWLAIEGKPVCFEDLKTSITIPVAEGELLEILASLGGRSLIETTTVNGKTFYHLGSLVSAYVTKQLIKHISGNGSLRKQAQRHALPTLEETIELTPLSKKPIHLSLWLKHRFESNWQPMDVLLGPGPAKQLSLRLRSTYHLRGESFVKRFKPIQLGQDNAAPVVALLVAIAEETDQKMGIRVQVQPVGEVSVLPESLKLSLVNDTGEILREVRSHHQDNFIQLPRFRGEPNDHFSIQVAWGEVSVTEEFVI